MISGKDFLLVGAGAAILALVIGVGRGSTLRLLLIQVVAIAHVTVVAALTLSPLPIDPHEIDLLHQYGFNSRAVNLQPFATIGPSIESLLSDGLDGIQVPNLLANLALLMPLAWYGPRLWPRLQNPLWFALAAIAGSTAIELLQWVINNVLGYPHSTDIDDVIVNASGAFVAFVALGAFGRLARRTRVAPDAHGRPPEGRPPGR